MNRYFIISYVVDYYYNKNLVSSKTGQLYFEHLSTEFPSLTLIKEKIMGRKELLPPDIWKNNFVGVNNIFEFKTKEDYENFLK